MTSKYKVLHNSNRTLLEVYRDSDSEHLITLKNPPSIPRVGESIQLWINDGGNKYEVVSILHHYECTSTEYQLQVVVNVK